MIGKYMPYIPFFGNNRLRFLFRNSGFFPDENSVYPYILFSKRTYNNQLETIHYYPNNLLQLTRTSEESINYGVPEQLGPNVFRLENVMWYLDQLAKQHKWNSEDDNVTPDGFIWRLPDGEDNGFKIFTPNPTVMASVGSVYVYTPIPGSTASFPYTTKTDRRYSNVLFNTIDLINMYAPEEGQQVFHLGDPYFNGGLIIPEYKEGYVQTDRDYRWMFENFNKGGQLAGISFDTLDIYRQIQKAWEFVGSRIFIDIPGKNYLDVNEDVSVTTTHKIQPFTDEYSLDTYSQYKTIKIQAKHLLTPWEIPFSVNGVDVYGPEEPSLTNDEPTETIEPGWLPLGPDVDSMCDYGKLSTAAYHQDLYTYLFETGRQNSLYYNNFLSYQSSTNQNWFNAHQAIYARAYNYFEQFFLPAASMSWGNLNTEIFTWGDSLFDNKLNDVTGTSGDRIIRILSQEQEVVTFACMASSFCFVKYQDVSTSQNNSEFGKLEENINDVGLRPFGKGTLYNSLIYSETLLVNNDFGSRRSYGFDFANNKIDKLNHFHLYYFGVLASSYSTVIENLYRDASDDIEVKYSTGNPDNPNDNRYIFSLKYTSSPKIALHVSENNNEEEMEKARNAIPAFRFEDDPKCYVPLTFPPYSVIVNTNYMDFNYNPPVEPNKMYVSQERMTAKSDSLICTYVGSHSYRSKYGVNNRTSPITKLYKKLISSGFFRGNDVIHLPNTITAPYRGISGSGGFGNGNTYFGAEKDATAKYEVDNGITDASGLENNEDIDFGDLGKLVRRNFNIDNMTVKLYYGFVPFPDSLINKDGPDMLDYNNYIKLCQYVRDNISSDNSVLLCEFGSEELFEYSHRDSYQKYNNSTISRSRTGESYDEYIGSAESMFIPREYNADIETMLDAEPGFDNAVMFFYYKVSQAFPTRPEGHITGKAFLKNNTGISVQNTSTTYADPPLDAYGQRIANSMFFDNNENPSQTNTGYYSSDSIAGFNVITHNANSGYVLNRNFIVSSIAEVKAAAIQFEEENT